MLKYLKPFHCHLKLLGNPLSIPGGGFLKNRATKTQKILKVPKHIAVKMAIKSNYILQKTFASFYKHQFKAGSKKCKMTKQNAKNCKIFG